MQQQVIPSLKNYGVDYWTRMSERFEGQLAKGTRPDGTPLTDAQKTRLQEQSRTVRLFLPKIESLRVVLPTVTLDGTLTIHQGDREIQLMHIGSGNTRGDVVVYLPKEKILATGDMLVHPVPFTYGSDLTAWIETLKRLRRIDADVIIPGHGPVMRDKEYLDLVIGLFESLLKQVGDAVKAGLSLADTKKSVNLESFRARMAGDDPVRRGTFGDSIPREAVERAYKAVKGQGGSDH
jgi:glyoxylase-like metal-dependent hydrolase (beta-lactamase superfamily II)